MMRLQNLTKPMEKPMIRNVFKTFGYVRVALAAAVGVPFVIAASAFAQNAAPPPPPPGAAAAPAPGGQAEVERVIVTGSNIPTAEEVGPNPVFSINRDLINKSGQGTTIEELLKSQPVMGGNSVPVQNNGTAQGGPTGTASVAGVVNLKLWKDYRGAQVTLNYGNTLDKDAALYSGDVLFGVGDDKMSITGDMFFYHHNSMFNHDRGNSLVPPFLSSNATPLNLQVSSDVAGAAGGQNLNPGGLEFTSAPNGTNGLAPASDFLFDVAHRVRGSGGLLPGFNFNSTSSSFPTQERWGGYAAFNDKICDDQLQIYGDFFYVDGKTHDELAPSATGNFETPGSFTIFIPPNAPIAAGAEPLHTPTAAEVGAPAGAF